MRFGCLSLYIGEQRNTNLTEWARILTNQIRTRMEVDQTWAIKVIETLNL